MQEGYIVYISLCHREPRGQASARPFFDGARGRGIVKSTDEQHQTPYPPFCAQNSKNDFLGAKPRHDLHQLRGWAQPVTGKGRLLTFLYCGKLPCIRSYTAVISGALSSYDALKRNFNSNVIKPGEPHKLRIF